MRAVGAVLGLCLAVVLAVVASSPARAQGAMEARAAAAASAGARIGANARLGGGREPITFQAGRITYDRERDQVLASGGVEAWEGDRVLRARSLRYDRATNRIFAEGDVALVEPNGNVLFADRVELTGDFRDGVLQDLRARLPENARLAANGARRSGGTVTELSRAVYSTCDLCANNPERPPLWQIRAERAQRDEEHGQIYYYDATLEMWGVPVFYLPYFEHADPAVKRRSGLLPPAFGHSSYLGGFVEIPYYWTLGPSADLTLAPMITSRQNVMLSGEYRRRFDTGELNLQASGTVDSEGRFRGHVFSAGRFDHDETWRWGYQFQRVSDVSYLRRYRFNQPRLLSSSLYAEGFGAGSYTLLDSTAYQGLRLQDDDRRLPIVMPRFYHEQSFGPDQLGGRLTADISSFFVTRAEGTDTQRLASRVNWQRPFRGEAGDLWRLQLNLDVAGYHAADVTDPTNPAHSRDGFTGRALPTLALDWRMPFVRHDSWSSQVIEPIVMLAAAPNTGRDWRIPNEDSLDFEFGDMNLFSLNRFTGRDRLEGGVRLNYGVRGALYTPGGAGAELLLGQSWRLHQDDTFFAGSGLARRQSDWVGRLVVTPMEDLDLFYRWRVDAENFRQRLSDAGVSVGPPWLRLDVGYTFIDREALVNPSTRNREELFAGFSTRVNSNWSLRASARRDLASRQMLRSNAALVYEDECFIFGLTYQRTFTQFEQVDPTQARRDGIAVLLRLVFKTVGEFQTSAF